MAGKRITDAYKAVEKDKLYSLKESVDLVKANGKAKFDETVEVAINLNLDTRHSDQQLRGSLQLPHGTGKTVRVAVFARGDKIKEAQDAGADLVGAEELVEQIQTTGELNFDRCIATPDMMSLLGKLGKVLGPKGLMPNPKLGTVTNNVAEAVKSAKSGMIEYRTEKAGIVHAGVGKVSFDSKALLENVTKFIDTIVKGKPSGVKGTYLNTISISSTMGPGINIDPQSINS